MSFFTSAFKNKIGRFVVVCLIISGSFLLFDRVFALILREANFRWNRIQNLKANSSIFDDSINVDVIIMGSSRTYRAINSDLLSRNTGLTVRRESLEGKYFKYNYLFYKKYREFSPAPKIILYGLDYFVNNIRSRDEYVARLGGSEGDLAVQRIDFSKYSNESSSFLSRVSILYRMRSYFHEFFVSLMNSIDSTRQNPGPKTGSGSKKKIKNIGNPEKYFKFPYIPLPGTEGEYLLKLLDLLKSDGVALYFLILPDYYGTYVSHISEDQYVKDFQSIAEKYPKVYIKNFNTLKRFDLKNQKLFRDGGYGRISSHLNIKGAEILTRKIGRFLKRNP